MSSANDARQLSSESDAGASSSSHPHPYSPRPRLFDNDILRAPPRDDLQASDILTDQDYRKLRVSTFTKAIVPGIVSAGVLSYFAPAIVARFRPPGPPNPGKLRTSVFIFALAGVMSYLSYTTVTTSVRDARREAAHRNLPRDQEGNVLIASRGEPHDRDPPSMPSVLSAGHGAAPAMGLGLQVEKQPRTRYLKGKGLDGEVEEEGEMRDTWYRPGTPRRDG